MTLLLLSSLAIDPYFLLSHPSTDDRFTNLPSYLATGGKEFSSKLWPGNEIAGSGSPKAPAALRYPFVASRRLPVGVTQYSSWQPQWTLETPCWEATEATRPSTRMALSITIAPLARAATMARSTARPIPRHLSLRPPTLSRRILRTRASTKTPKQLVLLAALAQADSTFPSSKADGLRPSWP